MRYIAQSFPRMFLLLAYLVGSSLSITRADEPPLLWQPGEHFYKAQGVGITAAWEAVPTTVAEDGELTATLTISGQTLIHPEQIVRPDLAKLPEFADRFLVVGTVDGPPVAADAKTVSFIYRLRPRNRSVDKIPTLEFYYYNPHAPESKRFMKTRAKSLPIAVSAAAPKAPSPRQVIPLDAPPELLSLAPGSEEVFGVHIESGLLSSDIWTPGLGSVLLVLLFGMSAASCWYILWKRVYPDAARLARLRRSRAARQALDAIGRAGRSTEPAATLANAVLNYIRTKQALPPGAETPGEIETGLRAAGVKEAEIERATDFFRRCDAARFAPAPYDDSFLITEAESIIAKMEERE